MRGVTNWKRNWMGLLTVLLAIVPTGIISAEEDSETADQYIIIELEPVLLNESESVLFSLQDSMESEEYSIIGIQANDPIIAQMLAQTADYQEYDTIALYELISYQQVMDGAYDFHLQIPEDADITLYQSVGGQIQKSTLNVAYTEEEYNRLPLISYQSETNHWLVLYLGANAGKPDSNTEDAVRETESAAESFEGKIESDTEEKPSEPSTAAPTQTPETQPQTTAHTHAWVPVTNVVHHDVIYKDVWIQDSAAWDETVITKAAWDEQVLVQDAYDENVLVSDAYDEPVYAWVDICNGCGHKFLDMSDDINEHMAAGCWSSWHAERMQVGSTHHDAVYQTVHHDAVYQIVHHEAETTTVHHDATGHTEKAVDQAAWDETVITGYTCSGCGSIKEN